MSMTVGELSTTRPHAVKVFQRHRIDFCCGGGLTLDEACAEKQLDVNALLAEITAEEGSATESAVRWDLQPMPDLIAHILERYHVPLWEDLERLEGMAHKVLHVHGHKDVRLTPLAKLVSAFRAELEPHLEKEEQVLFPWILRDDAVAPRSPISVMLREHDDVAYLLDQLVQLTGGYKVPDGACNTWTALWQGLEVFDRDLREHIAIENNVLFPRALREA